MSPLRPSHIPYIDECASTVVSEDEQEICKNSSHYSIAGHGFYSDSGFCSDMCDSSLSYSKDNSFNRATKWTTSFRKLIKRMSSRKQTDSWTPLVDIQGWRLMVGHWDPKRNTTPDIDGHGCKKNFSSQTSQDLELLKFLERVIVKRTRGADFIVCTCVMTKHVSKSSEFAVLCWNFPIIYLLIILFPVGMPKIS